MSPEGKKVVRKVYVGILILFLVQIGTIYILRWEAQQRINSFCSSELNTRGLFAFAISEATSDRGEEKPDTPDENARQRGYADRIEARLNDFPEECDITSEIRITTE